MSEAAREIIPENNPAPEVLPEARPPMAWHGFLVGFMLWLGAAWRLFQAAWILSGKIYFYEAVRSAVYSGLGALRILDYALAAACIAAAVLLVLARSSLKRRQRAGISRLLAAYMVSAAAMILYLLGRWCISGLPPLSFAPLGQAASCIALVLVNRSYYGKRRSLFAEKSKGV